MATISTNNLARAIYESSLGKEGDSLDFVVKNAVFMQLVAFRKRLKE